MYIHDQTRKLRAHLTMMNRDESPRNHHEEEDPSKTYSDASTTVLFPDLSLFDESGDEVETTEPLQLSQWAMAKIGTFQSRLETTIRAREQRWQKKTFLTNISTAEILRLANEAFGFNGWSSQILSCAPELETFDQENSLYSMKQRAKVRVTLQDGVYIEAEGVGEVLNMLQKHICLSNCKKMAITNGLRNAILGFKEMLIYQECSLKLESV